MLLLIPIFNLAMIFSGAKSNGWYNFYRLRKTSEKQWKADTITSKGTAMKTLGVICNIVLIVLSCWAFMDQYPHPKEYGFKIYALWVLLTPIISLLAIFHNRANIKLQGQD